MYIYKLVCNGLLLKGSTKGILKECLKGKDRLLLNNISGGKHCFRLYFSVYSSVEATCMI